MKKSVLSAALILLSFVILSSHHPILAQEVNFELLKTESLGPLKCDMLSEEVTKILDEPEEKTDSNYEAATGELVCSWIYKKKGIKLELSIEAKGDPPDVKPKIRAKWKVRGITIESPCDYKTKKGLGIGASHQSVLDAYKDSPLDFGGGKNSLVFGSIYGGLFFYFKDGKVVKIYLGPGAE